jgi:hypothetical protein
MQQHPPGHVPRQHPPGHQRPPEERDPQASGLLSQSDPEPERSRWRPPIWLIIVIIVLIVALVAMHAAGGKGP